MVANIAEEAGHKMFASFRTGAWWGQGEIFEDENMSGTEVLNLAGLDWSVHKADLFAAAMHDGEKKVLKAPKAQAIIRTGGRNPEPKILGTVGPDYECFQNHEMVDMLDTLAGDGKIRYEVAGALGKGEVVWVLAEIAGMRKAIGEDISVPYFMACTGHIGNKNMMAYPTSVRVVCQNTMYMAEQGRKGKTGLSKGYSFRHTKNMRHRVNAMVDEYEKAIAAWENTHVINLAMAGKEFDSKTKDTYLTYVADPDYSPKVEEARQKAIDEAPDKETKERLEKRKANQDSRRKNKVDALEKILESPTCQVTGTKNTVYSLLQAAIEWIDHNRSAQGENSGEADANRFKAANFGTGAELKQKAFEKALELV